jgi:predicted xylose isomerase-like sugar epimerase
MSRPHTGGAMNILNLYFEPSIGKMLQCTLEVEGYTVQSIRSAAEAVQIIESSSDSFLLLADNFHLNPEAQQTLTALTHRSELRKRVNIIGVSAMRLGASQWSTDNLIDDHLELPFTETRLLGIIEAYDEQGRSETC